MKIYYALSILFVFNLAYSQQIDLIDEGFDSGLSVSWTHNSTNWGAFPQWDVNSGALKESSGPYFGAVSNWIQMPAVDFTGVADPVLEFDLAMAQVDTHVQFSVWYLTGSQWNLISTYGTSASGASNIVTVGNASDNSWTPVSSDYQKIIIDLSQFTNESNIRFSFGSDYLNVMASGVWYLDNVKVFGNTFTSIVDESGTSSFEVYPNPANSAVRIIPSIHNEDAVLKITDVAGSIILEKPTDSAIEEIDVSNYEAGIYFVHYICEQEESVKKLIVY